MGDIISMLLLGSAVIRRTEGRSLCGSKEGQKELPMSEKKGLTNEARTDLLDYIVTRALASRQASFPSSAVYYSATRVKNKITKPAHLIHPQ